MDPTTAYRLAQYRMSELHAEAAAERLAAESRRNGRHLWNDRLAPARHRLRLDPIAAALRSLAARFRGIAGLAATEPDVPCR